MSEISDLESRISAAMDRIGRGLEGLKAASQERDASEADSAALAGAQETLEAEKARVIELESRIDALMVEREALEGALETARSDARNAAEALEAARDEAEAAEGKRAEAEAALAEAQQAEAAAEGIDIEDNRDLLNSLARRLRRMRQTSKELRASNQKLRDAMKAELPDAALVNQALEAEIESLRGLRDADVAEMNAINAALRPLLVPGETDKTAEGGA